jgi:cytokinin dehydrogenase
MQSTSNTGLSRRQIIQTFAAGATVIGFDPINARWVSSASAQVESEPFNELPPLQGTLHLDEPTRNTYAQDFGQIVHEYPLAVLKPGSALDIQRMLRFAQRHRILVVGRGRGHTAFGQSQVRAGIVIDLSTLQTVHHIQADGKENFVEVDAGIRWNALLDATLARGLMPPALTDFIGQTVGGTLSVGGLGGMTHRHGAQVDSVLALEVVTGDGELVRCSELQHRDLFNAVLAGQGQVGLIVRAKLRLIAAPARIRVFNLIYASVAALVADMQRLMDDERFDFLEGAAIRRTNGSYVYLLQAGSYYTPPLAPDAAALLLGLNDLRAALSTEDSSFIDFAKRVPEFPQRVHPWIDLILPVPGVEGFLAHVEQTLQPLVPGDRISTVLLGAIRTDRLKRPLFRAPRTRHAIGFGVLRTINLPVDRHTIEQALAYNLSLFNLSLDIGGTHYPISAVRLERHDWIRHYGEQFGRLLLAKWRYDRHNVLSGGPNLF